MEENGEDSQWELARICRAQQKKIGCCVIGSPTKFSKKLKRIESNFLFKKLWKSSQVHLVVYFSWKSQITNPAAACRTFSVKFFIGAFISQHHFQCLSLRSRRRSDIQRNSSLCHNKLLLIFSSHFAPLIFALRIPLQVLVDEAAFVRLMAPL